MNTQFDIPAYGIYGEDSIALDGVHCEPISARAGLYHWEIVAHRHRRLLQVVMLETGTAQAQVDGQALTLGSGDFLFLPVQSVHSFRFTPDTEGLVLSCPVELLAAFGTGQAEIAKRLERPFWGQRPPGLFGTLHQFDATAREAAFHREAILGLALFVLAGLAGCSAQGDRAVQRHPALDRLDRQIARDLAEAPDRKRSAAEHAAELGISTGHLSRLCRAQTGSGAAAYVEARVMEDACRYLGFTQLGVSQIAFRLGYPDPSYFARRFKQYSGQTPSDYRNRARRS